MFDNDSYLVLTKSPLLFLDLKPHQEKKRGSVELFKMTKALKILSTSQNDLMRGSEEF